jgi:hypothetical protein
VFIPELLKGNLCCCMKILHLHLGLLFSYNRINYKPGDK